ISSTSGSNSPYSFAINVEGFHTLNSWRQLYYGTVLNEGAAANLADGNGDLITNLQAFALGLDPTVNSVYPLEIESVSENEFTAVYTRSVFAEGQGILFEVEWSDEMPNSSWSTLGVTQTVIETLDDRERVRITVPTGGNPKRFMRLRISEAAEP
ncbi:MAG: hypothetical protein AAF357_08780, partial [Verrucomicrobiota bacterium]